MPISIEPVKELKQIEIQPSIDKVEESSVNSTETAFILLLVFIIFLLWRPILAFLGVVFKFGLISLFAYCGYILFIQ